jgi:hypothetical protein
MNKPLVRAYMKTPLSKLGNPKLKTTLIILGIATPLLIASICSAGDITVTNSGNWSSIVADNPWPNGVAATNTDSLDMESPGVITVDTTNATVNYIYNLSGTNCGVTMGPNSVLTILGTDGGQGAQTVPSFNASAAGNTVIYLGNAFWCKHTNYYNLTLSGFGALYNGEIGVPGDGGVPMTIGGDLILGGTANLQQAVGITILGNLTIGTNSTFDCSVGVGSVQGTTTINGTLIDYAGGGTLDDQFNNITVNPTGTWNLTDVVQWLVGGNVTNNGTIASGGAGGAGGITFTNTGIVTGNPFTMANLIVNGTRTIATTLTATNFVGFAGTMVFDLASAQHKIICNQPITYAGNLNVINTGPALTAGSSYQLFSAPGYSGGFDSKTLPSLPPGLTWVDDLATSGTISVASTGAGNPVVTSSQFNPDTHQFTLTWSSVSSVTYSVQYVSNLVSDSFASHVLATGIPSGGTQTSTTVTMPAGSTGFLRVTQP